MFGFQFFRNPISQCNGNSPSNLSLKRFLYNIWFRSSRHKLEEKVFSDLHILRIYETFPTILTITLERLTNVNVNVKCQMKISGKDSAHEITKNFVNYANNNEIALLVLVVVD